MARLNEVATLAVADALSSKDTALLDLVRGVETADPLCDRYLRLLMSEQPPAKPTRPIAKGHVHSWAALQRTLLRADAARIAALVTTPDHHDFARFSGWIPAVAWALTSGLPADRRAHALWGWVSEGGRPDGLDVLFERQREKPSFEARKSASWWGFDAVARRNNELLVYYYMGVRWRAPLVFENGLNAFWFLDHIDTAWEELLQDLSEDDIYWAERAREDGRVRHIVVHDATISATSEETLRRVSDHYGIAVEAADLMRV